MARRKRVKCGIHRSKCSCRRCVANCKFMPGPYTPEDLEYAIPKAIATNEGKVRAWARKYLRASSGTEVLRTHDDGRQEVIQTGTLVPSNQTNGSCIHLKNDRCEVHEDAPSGCAFFGCKQSTAEANMLSLQCRDEIEEDRARGGLYARLWTMLWEEGLRSAATSAKRVEMDTYLIEQKRQQSEPRQRRRLGW